MANSKSVLRIIMAASCLAAFSVPASAEELWDPHLRGVDEGMAAGAHPPPGVYFVVNNYWASFTQYDKSGKRTGVKLDALVEVPIVLWQTGITIFGGSYAVAVAQPFDYTNLRVAGTSGLSDNGHWGTYNTILVPGQISWTLPDDFHLLAGLSVYVDDASSSPAHPPAGGGVGSGNGFWTLQPDLGLSWLHDGWNVSLSLHYAFNFENTTTHYRSGDELAIDYTVAKTVGKWTFGIGAHQENQLTSDTGSGSVAAGCPARHGCKVSNFGIGPLVGFQFGGVEIMAEYNHNLYTENDVAGELFNLRLVSAL